MIRPLSITPYPSVNTVLDHFASNTQAILGSHFVGFYVYGSLALGDFNPETSDIDFIVVTDAELPEDHIAGLRQLHGAFAASDSRWAEKIEAAYIPLVALNHRAPTEAKYPQIEKELGFVLQPLEIGWPFQRYTLREHGLVVVGPPPRTLIQPVDPADMRRALIAIVSGWLAQAQHDPSWLDTGNQRGAQAFVVLTLCRSLYFLNHGTLASKPASAHWAMEALKTHPRWPALIERALASQHTNALTSPDDLAETLALLQYTFEQTQV